MRRFTNSAARHFRVATVFALLPAIAVGAEELASPDGSIRVSVGTDDGGVPHYEVRYDEEVVVAGTRLGLRFADQPAMESGFRIVDARRRSSETTWEQPWGERRFIRDHYNELAIDFEAAAPDSRRLTVRFRAYDDGIGFRYEVPAQAGYDAVDIVDELTEFKLALDATAFWIPGRGWNRYEYPYRASPVEDVPLAHTPMTVRLASGVHIALHEAALVDYSGYTLDQRRPGTFKTLLAPRSDGILVKTQTPFRTPWRTIQIAPDAVGLLNSNLILNLNEPNVLGDVSWVEPGKYVGIWWTMHLGQSTWGSGPDHGATTAETKRYIDFAAENGFDGVLVEGWNTGWNGQWFFNGAVFSFTEPYPEFDLGVVAEYAREKGVRLIGHHETSGHISNYESQLGAAFDLYESAGVRQVKTGYVADGGQLQRVGDDDVLHYEWHDGQHAVDHFTRVLREAAKRRISINTHEPVKDTGLRRTYPNWISREGARGQEYNAGWSAAPNPVEHDAMLAFTRMLSGPMDFTPGIFDLTHHGADSDSRVQTTLMHQLALYVVLYSPIQMAADLPENYGRFPDAFQFIRDVPTDWAESIALAGAVGDHVVYARRERDGDDWYLGGIGADEPRSLTLPLDFLDGGRTYRATVYRDHDDAHWRSNPYDYVIEEIPLHRGDSLRLRMAAGGGFAVRVIPDDAAAEGTR